MASSGLSQNLQDKTAQFFSDFEVPLPLHHGLNFTPVFEALIKLNGAPQYSTQLKWMERYHIQLLEEWLQQEKNIVQKATWHTKLKLALLMVAGTLYFGCEGFDGAMAVLGIFSLPTVLLFAGGIAFSLLYILVFYSFELVEVSSNLGIEKEEASDLIHLCLQELRLLKNARDKIFFGYQDASQEALQELRALCKLVEQRYYALALLQTKLTTALDNPLLQNANLVLSVITGLLFFSGGFFAGQTVAMVLAATILGPGAVISTTFWPVLVTSLVIGMAATSIYWFVERPSIEVYVSQKFGLDSDLIEAFSEKDLGDKIRRCAVLSRQIDTQIALRSSSNGVDASASGLQKHSLFASSNEASFTLKAEEEWPLLALAHSTGKK